MTTTNQTIRRTVFGFIGAGALIVAVGSHEASGTPGHDPVVICHKPGTPAQRTITIDRDALPAHLAHYDTEGPCPTPTVTTTPTPSTSSDAAPSTPPPPTEPSKTVTQTPSETSSTEAPASDDPSTQPPKPTTTAPDETTQPATPPPTAGTTSPSSSTTSPAVPGTPTSSRPEDKPSSPITPSTPLMLPNDSPRDSTDSELRQSELTWPEFLRQKAHRNETTPAPAPAQSAPKVTAATPNELPYTGINAALGVGAATILLGAGGALTVAGRKRRES